MNDVKILNVLIACEESQRVCMEFRRLGHNAYSCDLMDCSGGHPEWHVQQDCLPLLNGDCEFVTVDGTSHNITGEWDIIIAHPPCTYLTNTQSPYYDRNKWGDEYVDKRIKAREEGFKFFMAFTSVSCKHVAIENPVGYPCTHYRHADQIVHPYYFGNPVSKRTAFWLKGLPKLVPTNMLTRPGGGWKDWYRTPNGKWDRLERNEQGKMPSWGSDEIRVIRSKTYPGIAKAMAEQWSNYLLSSATSN